MDTDVAIQVSGVSKWFKLPHEKHTSLKSAAIGFLRGGDRKFETQKVLNDVSLEINKGDFFGIVGRNGSGKSTLLKIISQIYAPNQGTITVNGKLTPFIELGVGFNPELTGRENVFLNGALLGFNRKDMYAMYDEIVAFAELEKFMDQKLKNYSSGMQVRLAFSIAIKAETDILLLDEVLAVGDEAFQRKCTDYFEQASKNKKTIILVTHDMNSVRRFCTRAAFIEDGKVKKVGTPADIADIYTQENLRSIAPKNEKDLEADVADFAVRVVSPLVMRAQDSLELELSYKLNRDIAVDVGFSLVYRDISILQTNTRDHNKELPTAKGKLHKVRYTLPLNGFAPVELEVYGAIFKKDGFVQIGKNSQAATIVITDRADTAGGLMVAKGTWELL